MRWNRRLGRRRGYLLFAAAAGSVAILGMLGLCLDLARLYIAKNELQNFTDAASIAAANRLDGTVTGISDATTEATNNVNKWSFGQNAVATVNVAYSTTVAGAYSASPNPAVGYNFVRVQAAGQVPIYFMPIFSGIAAARGINATSVAGAGLEGSLGDGGFPFSPDAHVPLPVPIDLSGNFGYIKGQIYTLRWDPVGKGSKVGIVNSSGNKMVGCVGDMTTLGFIPGADNNGQRGYIDLQAGGGGGGAAFIREAILGGADIDPVNIGDLIDNAGGNKQTEIGAILERIASDTNAVTQTYYTAPAAGIGLEPPGRTYYDVDPPGQAPASPPRGNGRRIVTVPMNNPTTDIVIGFAQFFLPLDPCPPIPGPGSLQPCCAEYIGPATRLPSSGGATNGSGSPGIYRIKLFQ